MTFDSHTTEIWGEFYFYMSFAFPGWGGGGYSIYPWVGRCGPAPHTLTLSKTNITDFPTLFKTELQFLIPCLRLQEVVWLSCCVINAGNLMCVVSMPKSTESILITRACENFAVHRPRKDILFKTKIDKPILSLRQKMINSIPCLRQKSRKTYPGWPHVPIKPL